MVDPTKSKLQRDLDMGLEQLPKEPGAEPVYGCKKTISKKERARRNKKKKAARQAKRKNRK